MKIKEDTVQEILLVVGFLLLSYGVWKIYPPASLIISGALLMWLGYPMRIRRGS